MKLYREALIESAEQADELPDGRMAYRDDSDAYGSPVRDVAVKHRGEWWADDRTVDVVGWTQLAPFEADSRMVSDSDDEALTYYEAWVRES